MAISKVTGKGQVTIPKAIREVLGVEPGDRVDFRVAADGEVVVEAATVDLMSLFGTVKPNRSLTLDEMDEAIARGARGE